MQKLVRTFSLVLFSATILLLVLDCAAQQPKAAAPSPQQHAVPPPAPKSQEQFLVYWTTEAGWNTELLLRNNLEAGPLTVTPALRTPDGAETSLPAVTIQSGDVASVDLFSTLLKVAPQLTGAWGSLVLRYTSAVNGALYASAMVRADARPIAFHLDAYGRGTIYEVGSREGIWWLPWDTVTDYLILTNSGEQSIQPNLVLYDSSGKAWLQQLSLSSHETRRLSVRTLLQQAGLQGSYGGIKIDMVKGARYLDSAHLLFEESGSFSAVMKMFRHDPSTTLASRSFGGVKEWTTRAPMLALSSPDPALGFPAGTTLQPKIFIRNASNKTFTAHLQFNWRSASASGKSVPTDLPLKANETKLIDVAALQAQKTLPPDANWAAVILSAPVLPNELLAVAASYDQTGRYGAQTPFNDQLAPHWEGGKWEVDGTHNSLVTINNGGNKSALAQLTIFYNQGAGQYQLEQMLAPDQQMPLDFGKLIHDRIPDKNGQSLPPNLTSGAYRILELTDDHAAADLYEGKVIVDKTYGHASYGCTICCGPTNPYMEWNPLYLFPGGSWNQQIQSGDSCTRRLTTITGDFPTWWTDSTTTATASSNKINGIAVGATGHHALSDSIYWGPLEDSGGGPCPLDQQQADAGTNVTPTISQDKSLWFFGTNVPTPSGFTLGSTNATLTANGAGNGTYVWTITSGTLQVVLENGGSSITKTNVNTVGISSVFESTAADDVTIQLQWTPSGGSQMTVSYSLSVDSPYKLVPTPGKSPVTVGLANGSTCQNPVSGSDGYETGIPYNLVSFFGVLMANGGINETFNGRNDVVSPNTWAAPTPGGNPAAGGQFFDCVLAANSTWTPPTKYPGTATIPGIIVDFSQTWYAASQTPGTGLPVQFDQISYYQDHGAHLFVDSPVR